MVEPANPLVVSGMARRNDNWEIAPIDIGQSCEPHSAMEKLGSVAIVGAGDFIGSAIARTFAAAGYAVHGGRRNGVEREIAER